MLASIPGIPLWSGLLLVILGAGAILLARRRLGRGLGIIALAAGVAALLHPQSHGPGVSVEAEASRAFYDSMGLGGGATSPVEYKVKLTIHNTGSGSLEYDQIEAEFYPLHGRHLKLPTFAYDPRKGSNAAAYEQGANRSSRKIAPGASEDLELGTDGYTNDLLGEAEGQPLRFSIAVLLKGATIAGPYVALLPPPNDLPSYEQAQFADGPKPVKLAFTGAP